jgi:hypothetical protein
MSASPPPPPAPPRHDPRLRSGPPSSGCGSALLILFGLIMLLPGACVIFYVIDSPRDLFAPGAGVLWTFLAVGAGGMAVIVLAIREAMRR